MQTFDPKSYLGQVLGPYERSPELPSLFDRYLLDVEDADEAAIAQRLDEVKRYWDKRLEHPRYGSTIRLLADMHAEAKLTLGDARERGRLADEVRSRERQESDARAQAVREWDELLAQAIEAAKGLDPAQRARLERMAESTGIAGPEVKAKLDAAPAAPEPDVLDPSQRETIAQALLGLARGLGEPRVGLSLFHALDLEVTDDLDAVRARHRERVQESRRRRHDNTKANWESVLSLVKIHLLENDARAYVQGLAADVRKRLEPRAIKAVTDDEEIDEVEAEQLVREALDLGLTPELAREAVAELAREQGAALRLGATVDFVACPSCNNPHRRDAGEKRCRGCGTPLFVDCPNECGTRNDATAARCTSCGADLHRFSAATRAVVRLPELLASGRVGQAQEDLQAAVDVLDASNPEVAAVSKQVTAAVEAAKRGWAEVEAARADRHQHRARRLLGDLEKSARDFPGPSGELPSQALEAVRARIGEAEALLGAARRLSGPTREQPLIEALQIAADCEEAVRELDKLPPEPPATVEVASSGTAMTVRWAASPAKGVRYVVTRNVAGTTKAIADTEALQAEDGGAPAGAIVRYSVEAVRGKARSPAAASAPVAALYEVGNLVASEGDGEVRLSWSPQGKGGRVLVTRTEEGGARPVQISPDASGVVDRDVVNGRRYTYLVRVEYPGGSDGEAAQTPGLTVFAQPVERPVPLAGLSVRSGPAGVLLSFDPPRSGTVSIFRCAEDPALQPGSELDPARLAELGRSLPIEGSTAVDAEAPTGRCFYQAVTVAGAIAIAGAAVRHVSLPEISNVRAVAEGRRARVTWSWPEGIRLARLVWRHDRQPEGPEDPGTRSIDYRLGEYRDGGGCSIELGGKRALFVAVYPATRGEDGIAYGSAAGKGSRASLRAERKTELRYSVRRAGMLQKRLEVEISDPGNGALPELVLVGREGEILPRSVRDGTVLARLGGDGPRSSSLDLRQLSRPLAVRLFLDSASAAGEFVLFDPMADDLLIG